MMRSKELRSVTRSLITGKALARQGSIVIVSASWKWRMCNWRVAVPRCPPCGTPLMTSEHMPQMPSRQSESKAIGSSLRAMSSSFTTSSISRKDMSGRTAFASYVLKRPGVVAFFWRQTFRVRFMTAKWRMTNDPAKRERKNDEIRMTKQLRHSDFVILSFPLGGIIRHSPFRRHEPDPESLAPKKRDHTRPLQDVRSEGCPSRHVFPRNARRGE